MIAVIKTGGKQYLVSPGDKIKVEKLETEEGKNHIFGEVLLYTPVDSGITDGKLEIGSPLLKGVTVTAKVVKNVKGKKLIIFKYKPKKRYKRKIGHRQQFTEVEILEIKV